MEKTEILDAIRHAAKQHGSAPGRAVFERLTGVKMGEWYGRYWASWGDALTEAGFAPNELQSPLRRIV